MNNKKIKVLVTGSSSLVGSTIASFLKEKKFNIYTSYNKFKRKFSKKKSFKINFSRPQKLKHEFDILIHCASAVPNNTKNTKDFYKINYLGLKSFLSKNIIKKKIIFISSVAVYGEFKKKTLTIDTNKYAFKKNHPNHYYGKSKLLAEKYLETYCKKKGLKLTIFRLPGVVGKNSKNNFISELNKNLVKNKKRVFFNPKLKFNNLIHVDDISKNIFRIINKKNGDKINIYNLACSKPIYLFKIIELFCKINNIDKSRLLFKNSKNSFNISVKELKKQKLHTSTTINTIKKFIKENNFGKF